MEVIDSHAHFGKGYSFREYLSGIKGTPICGAVAFPLASDIYQRGDKNFCDSPEWKKKRRLANKCILSLGESESMKIKVYPFKFIWNDFSMADLSRYSGAKWHRRDTDPTYRMGSEKFARFIRELRERKMPIVFEDEFENIMKFLTNWSEGINVIIPHLGYGGRNYNQLREEGVWEMENVYSDTSYVSDSSTEAIESHIKTYGHERILFGSDYPLSEPKDELEGILRLNLSEGAIEAITSRNILRLLERKK